MLAGGAFKPLLGQDRVNQCIRHTAPYYQREVLAFMHGLQWGQLIGSTDVRWLLNGLDWGPLFVEGTFHLAAVLYPRIDLGRTEAEWGAKAEFARVLDPWIEQRATFYTWPEWMSQLADPSLRVGVPTQPAVVRVQTKEYIDGQFGGTATPSHFYPANHWNYYRSDETVPEPFTDEQRTNWIQMLVDGYRMIFKCPVYVTVTDSQGRRTGYVANGGVAHLAAEAPGAILADVLRESDGTAQWSFLTLDGPFTITVEAYTSGPFTATIQPPDTGRIWEYTTQLSAGDTATLQVPAGATAPPLMRLSTGASVTGTAHALFKAGVYPATSLVMGGDEAIVTGVDISPGASVTIGGVTATDVTWLNGTTAKLALPRGTAGVQDVTVTNPGQAPQTIAQAFTYEYVKRYFAEGATSDLFDTRIALLNPTDRAAAATLHFQRSDGTTVNWPVPIGAHSRATVDARTVPGMTAAEFATTIDADETLVVDRTMRWSHGGPDAGYGAHTERGVLAPAPVWYLAEGATHSGFDLFYLIQNPEPSSVTSRSSTCFQPRRRRSSRPTTSTVRRFNIWVDDEAPRLAATDVSAVITSDDGSPIIVERAMYLTSAGAPVQRRSRERGRHRASRRSGSWRRARRAAYFDLFILVANPTDIDALIEVGLPAARRHA